jgi:hypothetical protein
MWHLDKHVVKMILETCQLLCTAIWLSGKEAPLKKTHVNHPSAIWCRQNKENWIWLKHLGLALCKEYTYRYEKIHKLQDTIENLKVPNLPEGRFFEPTPAMHNCYKEKDSLTSYRNYYLLGKCHLHFTKSGNHCWKKREIPPFIKNFYDSKN